MEPLTLPFPVRSKHDDAEPSIVSLSIYGSLNPKTSDVYLFLTETPVLPGIVIVNDTVINMYTSTVPLTITVDGVPKTYYTPTYRNNVSPLPLTPVLCPYSVITLIPSTQVYMLRGHLKTENIRVNSCLVMLDNRIQEVELLGHLDRTTYNYIPGEKIMADTETYLTYTAGTLSFISDAIPVPHNCVTYGVDEWWKLISTNFITTDDLVQPEDDVSVSKVTI